MSHPLNSPKRWFQVDFVIIHYVRLMMLRARNCLANRASIGLKHRKSRSLIIVVIVLYACYPARYNAVVQNFSETAGRSFLRFTAKHSREWISALIFPKPLLVGKTPEMENWISSRISLVAKSSVFAFGWRWTLFLPSFPFPDNTWNAFWLAEYDLLAQAKL